MAGAYPDKIEKLSEEEINELKRIESDVNALIQKARDILYKTQTPVCKEYCKEKYHCPKFSRQKHDCPYGCIHSVFSMNRFDVWFTYDDPLPEEAYKGTKL